MLPLPVAREVVKSLKVHHGVEALTLVQRNGSQVYLKLKQTALCSQIFGATEEDMDKLRIVSLYDVVSAIISVDALWEGCLKCEHTLWSQDLEKIFSQGKVEDDEASGSDEGQPSTPKP